MSVYINQRIIEIPINLERPDLIRQIESYLKHELDISWPSVPIRLAVTKSDSRRWTCELGVSTAESLNQGPEIFKFRPCAHEDASSFNVVMLVPTGIGAMVGGHAGDATPAATLMASVCDTLITHPNVLNASDIIQIPPNALYVEGSLITQLMMGSIGLRRARNNRLLVLVQSHEESMFPNAAINSVNAARASYGLNADVVEINPKFRMISEYTPSGGAAGRIDGIEHVFDILDTKAGEYGAIAVTSVIELPRELHQNYYRLVDELVNPWGGVEAMLTHALSLRYGLPSAHAPMFESREISEMDLGVVDPRMAAEVISVAFLQCVLRGLQRSPGVSLWSEVSPASDIQSENVSCLVIPDGCIGLPTLAALANGIPVIAVRGNTNQMRNDLSILPWKANQLFQVENYLEAAGVVSSLRVGLNPWSTTRPLESAQVERVCHDGMQHTKEVSRSSVQAQL